MLNQKVSKEISSNEIKKFYKANNCGQKNRDLTTSPFLKHENCLCTNFNDSKKRCNYCQIHQKKIKINQKLSVSTGIDYSTENYIKEEEFLNSKKDSFTDSDSESDSEYYDEDPKELYNIENINENQLIIEEDLNNEISIGDRFVDLSLTSASIIITAGVISTVMASNYIKKGIRFVLQ